MINYEWDCKTVDVYPTKENHTDVVYNVHWRVYGEDSETAHKSVAIGTQILDVSNITDFIPIADLTNAQLTQWVKDALGAETVDRFEKSIADQIAEQINPTSITMTIEN